ncbi:hypothetical protein BV20DRAFT_929989, partial [Pilatotrama ljubarskyi]
IGRQVGNGAWRWVHVAEHKSPQQPPRESWFVLSGTHTEKDGLDTERATMILAGDMGLATRQKMGRLALEVSVVWQYGKWNCQNWLLDLLSRTCHAGIISQQRRAEVV